MADIKIISPAERYKAIADAIREKSGTTELMQPADMPQAILDIVSGGGSQYTSIVYNEDNTITLTDKDGVIHTMECEYTDGKLTSVKYDGKVVDLTYNGDLLVKVGKTAIDMENAPATSGATFNIAYGETPPEDTSKLWIKANEPANVSVGSDIDGVESVASVGAYLPIACKEMGCARVGNKIYILGGYGSSALNTIQVFDIETKTTATLETTLPSTCRCSGCASVGNKIYILGGKGLNTINVFDAETETVATLATILPANCQRSGCVRVGNKIYLFGGVNLNTIIVFDIETEIVSTLPVTLPNNIYGMACESVGNKIYLFGGYVTGSKLNTIYEFDIETNRITTLATTLPNRVYNMGCAKVGTKIYLFGGYDGVEYNTIYEFDTETKAITTLAVTLPNACYDVACSSYGNKIYLLGGSGYSLLNTINCFSVGFELAHNNLELQTGSNNKFNLINTDNAQVQIGVENVYVGNENNEAERVDAYLHNGTEWAVIE
jgi:N-acetylneuraminic acid mutarotase